MEVPYVTNKREHATCISGTAPERPGGLGSGSLVQCSRSIGRTCLIPLLFLLLVNGSFLIARPPISVQNVRFTSPIRRSTPSRNPLSISLLSRFLE